MVRAAVAGLATAFRCEDGGGVVLSGRVFSLKAIVSTSRPLDAVPSGPAATDHVDMASPIHGRAPWKRTAAAFSQSVHSAEAAGAALAPQED
jgi:hypothetical protein